MKPPSIKAITKQDLYEYLAYTRKEGADSGWKKEQAEIIGSVLCEENIILGLIDKMKNEGPDSMSILDAFLSLMIFGFQCGREFEYRQMVKAMRSETK